MILTNRRQFRRVLCTQSTYKEVLIEFLFQFPYRICQRFLTS